MTYRGKNESAALMQLITSNRLNWPRSVIQTVLQSDHWLCKFRPLVPNTIHFSSVADLLFHSGKIPGIQVCYSISSRNLFLEFEKYLEEMAYKQIFFICICYVKVECSGFILCSELGGIILGNVLLMMFGGWGSVGRGGIDWCLLEKLVCPTL